jgi:hypothetical protein
MGNAKRMSNERKSKRAAPAVQFSRRYAHGELSALRLEVRDARGRRIQAVRSATLVLGGVEVAVLHPAHMKDGHNGPAQQTTPRGSDSPYDVVEFVAMVRGGTIAPEGSA